MVLGGFRSFHVLVTAICLCCWGYFYFMMGS